MLWIVGPWHPPAWVTAHYGSSMVLRLPLLRLLLLPLLLSALLAAPALADSVWACVDQVSTDSYSSYLYNYLRTRTGDDRNEFTADHDAARDNIYSLFTSYGLDTTIQTGVYASRTYSNVVGVHLGTANPDEIYIVGAHYDSVGSPGADDNASGVAGVLEAARILSQYESDATIVFIAFDREEDGLFGSYAYAQSHAGDNIQGMISMDMIAYNPAGAYHDYASIYNNAASDPLGDALEAALTTYGGLTVARPGTMNSSDHYPFQQRGFQALLMIEYSWASNPYYHTATDTVDTADYLDYVFATDMTRGAVGLLADQAGTYAPEPTTTALMASALVALGVRLRGRRRVKVTLLRFPGS